MHTCEILNEKIKNEIFNNIQKYGTHNIFLIDIEEICNNNRIQLKEVFKTIENDINYYMEYIYILVIIQVYILVNNEYEAIDNRFYEKLSEYTGIEKDKLEKDIIPMVQEKIWNFFYKEIKKKNIRINECKERTGPHRYVNYPKSQIYYTIGKIKATLGKKCSPYHEYTKNDFKKIINREGIIDDNDYECAVEQVYTYYKIHGIPEYSGDKKNNNIENKKYKDKETVILIYNHDNEKPILYIENNSGEKEIESNEIKKYFKNNDILLFRKKNSWQYEYSKYYYMQDELEYGAIISKRYYEDYELDIIKINNEYYFIPILQGKIKEIILRINDEYNINDKQNQIIFQDGIKIGRRKWLQGYGPKIINKDLVFINGKKVHHDYLRTCKSGTYTVRTKYDMEIVEIIDEYINMLDYNGWKIDKDKIIPSSENYNIKGMKLLIEDETNYAKNVYETYSGFNVFKGENKWIMKYWEK